MTSDGSRSAGRPAHHEPDARQPFDAAALVVACVERGARSLLLDERVLPRDFFDLSTGMAGELLHHLTKYRIRLATVVRDPAAYSERFREFSHEANRGAQFRFFPSRQEALDWLASSDEAQARVR